MAYVKSSKKTIPNEKGDSLRNKAVAMLLLGIVILLVSFVVLLTSKSKDILVLGVLISAFMFYKGVTLIKDLENNRYVSIVLICTAIDKSGYRKQNQTVTLKRENPDSYFDITLPRKAESFQLERQYKFYFKPAVVLNELSQINPCDVLGWEKM